MASRHADTARQNRYYDDSRDGRRSYNRRDEDSYRPRGPRRSRSPDRERRRSRERDRLRDHRDRSRDRPRHRDDRDRDIRDRDIRKRDDSRDRDRRRRERSPRPELSTRRGENRDTPRQSDINNVSEEERKQQEKLARVEAWKAKMAALKQGKGVDGNAATPPAAPSPKPEQTQVKADAKTSVEKPKPKQPSSSFKLDEKVTEKNSRPATSSVERKAVVNGNQKAVSIPAQPIKASGNVSSFGLKGKSKAAVEKSTSKNSLFDDEEVTQKRTLEKLPDFIPEEHPVVDGDDDVGEGDIVSDDEDTAAAQLAAAEKRRDEANNEDVEMADSTTATATIEPADDAMVEDEEVDPLDAFMSGLQDPTPATNGAAPQGVAMFGDDNEVDMEAVEGADDLWALANKKKKREIPTVDHKKVVYEPFRKNFYVEPTEIQEMTNEEVADLRLELDGIKIRGGPKGVYLPKPVQKWGQMGLSAQTLEVLRNIGYERPTAVQCQAIPVAESGLDMISVAKTGSGKTLAFGIPFIRHIMDQRPLSTADGPVVLILAPTRELSVQIVRELKPFLKASSLKAVCCYGGAPIKDQIGEIKRGGNHVLCATPGRLIDLLASNQGRVLNFKRVTYVVLDEADRMFDMGFEPQVMKILANIRPDRQTVLFSATFPKNMESLAKKILSYPVEVIVGGRSVVAPEITQIIRTVPPQQKMTEVLRYMGELFMNDEDARALVFVERQETAEDVLKEIMDKGYPCNSIHGGKDQVDRTDAIDDFKSGALPILIATSIAARGLDISQLKLVINYDCPTHLEDYVHRCGRTGRAGQKGTAVTLIEDPNQERFSVHIAKALKQSGQPVPDELQKMVDSFMAKVQAGTEKWSGSGFGGKGLERLDAEREKERLREKRAYKTGDDKDEEEEEKEEDDFKIQSASAPAPAPAPAPVATPTMPSNLPDLDAEIVVKRTERPAAESGKGFDKLDKVKQAAARIDGRLSRKNMIHPGQPIDNKGPDAGAFHATVEINDFPQKARWGVTNRTNVAKILESTGTSTTTKGNYYPPGTQPEEGQQPKLYILVEGETENVVAQAMRELHRLLKEGTLAANDADSRAPASGRYSVV